MHNAFSVSCAQKAESALVKNRKGMTFLVHFRSLQGSKIVCLPRKFSKRDIKNNAGNGHLSPAYFPPRP